MAVAFMSPLAALWTTALTTACCLLMRRCLPPSWIRIVSASSSRSASRHLGAAGLDVPATQPLPRDHPLLALGNVVLSPGVAARTPEALRRAFAVAVENARRLRNGRPLLHRIV